MNKAQLNIAKAKRKLGWTYTNIAAYLQLKGARTRSGGDFYSAYVTNELNSQEIGRSRLDDRIAQKKKIFDIIKKCKASRQKPALNWIEITTLMNHLCYKNMRGKAFLTASLKGIYRELKAAAEVEKKDALRENKS